MSFGKTFFTGVSENPGYIPGPSKWDVYINGVFYDTIELESENLPLTKSDSPSNTRSFTYNGVFNKDLLAFKAQNIILELHE